ncbi:FimV family protein [Spongiibacter marinus]|uniref:FimV family protein n=1 Tax=Spongiibacter marinus TaxID=354246 RepID=UPI0035BEA226
MKKLRAPAFIPLLLAVAVSPDATAMGLGRAELDSVLGKPLAARVVISGAEGLDPEQILIDVKPVWDAQSDSAMGGLDTRTLTVRSELSPSGSGVIYLRSTTPIVEPFLNFVLSVRWPTGTIEREYTLLLDLPAQAPALASAAQAGAASTRLASGKPAQSNRPAKSSPARPISADASTYTTVRGDSLWRVASRIRRARGGEQLPLMEAVYRLNPQAFVRGEKDMLKESVSLNVEAAALAEVLLPGGGPGGSGKQISRAPNGTVNSEVETAPEASTERVVLSSNAAQTMTEEQRLTASLAAVTEEVSAVRANIEAMNSRLQTLQTRLLSLQDEYTALKGQTVAIQAGESALLPAVSVAEPLAEASQAGEQAVSSTFVRGADVASASPSEVIQAGVTATDTAPIGETTGALPENAEWRGSPWALLLLGVAAVGGLLFYRRRKAAAKRRLQAFHYAGAAKAAPKASATHFEDVFAELGDAPQEQSGSADIAAVTARVVEEDNSPQAAAAACIELGDYRGAQQIVEQALREDESLALQMLLLDLYARQGQATDFEALALQMEFAGVEEESLREIDILRRELNDAQQHRTQQQGQ